MMQLSPGSSRPPTWPERVLLLALLPIGDTIFAAPTIYALRARYPQARITALAHVSNAPILRCIPAIDEVLVLPPSGWGFGLLRMASMLWSIRARHFHVAVSFTSPWYKWMSLLSGSPVRTYMKFDPLWWLLPAPHARWRSTHATRHYYDCARELDLLPWDQVDRVPRLLVPPAERQAARAWLWRRGIAPGAGPLVAIHPGGAGLHGHKRWPIDRFAQVADTLAERWHARVVLLGGPDESELAGEIAALMHGQPLIAAGTMPLLTSVALIAECALFIGNDSSLLHGAAAVGTPYVGIYGPTCLANFQPVPTWPRLGRLVAAWPPCAHPSYFVGGRPVWQRPRCQESQDILARITVDDVLVQIAEVMQPLSAATEGPPRSVGQEPLGAR